MWKSKKSKRSTDDEVSVTPEAVEEEKHLKRQGRGLCDRNYGMSVKFNVFMIRGQMTIRRFSFSVFAQSWIWLTADLCRPSTLRRGSRTPIYCLLITTTTSKTPTYAQIARSRRTITLLIIKFFLIANRRRSVNSLPFSSRVRYASVREELPRYFMEV